MLLVLLRWAVGVHAVVRAHDMNHSACEVGRIRVRDGGMAGRMADAAWVVWRMGYRSACVCD